MSTTDLIIYNSFNGFGDVIGSDEYGFSVAWLDLHDHLETSNGRALDPSEVEDLEEAAGGRYVIAYLHDNGIKEWVAFEDYSEMKKLWRELDAEYSVWEKGGEA